MNANNIIKLVGTIFLIVGLAMIIPIVLVSGHSKNLKQKGENVTAVISDITRSVRHSNNRHRSSSSGHTYIDYEYNGVSYEHKSLGYYSSTMRVGDNIEICILPEKPQSPYFLKGYTLAVIILGSMCFVFSALGLTLIISGSMLNKNKSRLLEEGTPVSCKVTGTRLGNVRVNGRLSQKLVCVDDYGAEYVSANSFRTDEYPMGGYVTVYIDRENPQNYYVDIN